MMRWLWVVLLFVGCLEEFPELMTQPPRETQLDGTVDQAITDVLPVQDMEPVPPRAPMLDELFINEVDYDQGGVDVAEFVEIYNASDSSLLLRSVHLVFISYTENDDATYMTSDLVPVGTVIQPHGYAIFAKEGAQLPGGILSYPVLGKPIQNKEESIVLFVGDTELDSVTYGTPETLTDVPTTQDDPHSLARCPDGRGELKYVPGTPGAPNVCN